MKFVNIGDRHQDTDFFEDLPKIPDEGKPRRTPSYFETAKKHKPKQSGTRLQSKLK